MPGAIVLLLLAAWLVMFITRGRFLKHPFERLLSAQLERRVAVGGEFDLYFDPFDISFLAQDISIANPAWTHDPQRTVRGETRKDVGKAAAGMIKKAK